MASGSSVKASGCQYNYVVTAQRPTAVTHTAVGHLTDEHETDLIVGSGIDPLMRKLRFVQQEEHHTGTLHTQERWLAGTKASSVAQGCIACLASAGVSTQRQNCIDANLPTKSDTLILTIEAR